MSKRNKLHRPSQPTAAIDESKGGSIARGAAFADPAETPKGVKPSGDSALRGLRGSPLSGFGGQPFKERDEFHFRKYRPCAYTGCKRLLRGPYIACGSRSHWAIVPPTMRDRLVAARIGDPDRRDAWKAVARYLDMRSRFKTKAGAAS